MNTTVVITLAVGLIILGLVQRLRNRRSSTDDTSPSGRSRVREMIAANARIVDVRTRSEYAVGHIEGADNLPLDEIAERADELGERSRPLVLYCRTGARSEQAVAILRRLGFTDVVNGGGLDEMRSL